MDPVRGARLLVGAVIVAVLLVSGPLVGAVDLTPADRGIGDGTAEVTVERTDDPVIDRGRFGTNVTYLRIPPAVVDVHGVEGRPRLVYTVRVPALGFERTATRLVDRPGRTRVRMSPRAFERTTYDQSSYRAELLVRVQSFETDEVVYRRNVSVDVRT